MKDTRFQPERLIHLLVKHQVRFVVVGGVAATLHGSAMITGDVDVAYERKKENLARLADALREAHADLRGVEEDLPFSPDQPTLQAGTNFTFITDLGNLDCLGWIEGIASYEALASHAVVMRIGDDDVQVASLDDLIAMKQAAGRSKDRIAVLELDEIKKMREEQG